MDSAALRKLLGELLAPIREELHIQSSVLNRLSEDVAALKGRFSPVQDPTRKPVSAVIRKSAELPSRPRPSTSARTPEAAKRREIITKSTHESDLKRLKIDSKPSASSKSHSTKPEDSRKLPLFRKSFTAKPLISRIISKSPEDCDNVEIESIEESEIVEEVKEERKEERLQTAESVKEIVDFGRNESLAGVDGELKRLLEVRARQKYGEPVLLESIPFQLSTGARSALSLLGTLDESSLFLTPSSGENEVLWLFRLFFQLCRDPLPLNSSSAWHSLRLFLTSALESGLEDKVLELITSFSWSNENIDQLSGLIDGQVDRLNPSLYSAASPVAGLIAFPVKEAVAYAGLIPEKVQPWRQYQRLLYQRKKAQ